MFTTLLETISHWTVQIIEAMGYLGIFVTMAIESACIPLPSEVIMPFSGYLVGTGTFGFWEVSLLGALGNVVGSWIAYGVGLWGGAGLHLKIWKIYSPLTARARPHRSLVCAAWYQYRVL